MAAQITKAFQKRLEQAALEQMTKELQAMKMAVRKNSGWYEASGNVSPKYSWLMPESPWTHDEKRAELARQGRELEKAMRRRQEKKEEDEAIASIMETMKSRG